MSQQITQTMIALGLTLLLVAPGSAHLTEAEKIQANLSEEGLYQRTVKLYQGEELSYRNHSISYFKYEGGDFEKAFSVDGENFSRGFLELDFYRALEKAWKLDESLYIVPEDPEYEESSSFMPVKVFSDSLDVFGGSRISIDAPNFIEVREGFEVPVKIENTGGVVETYNLSVTVPGKVEAYFTEESYRVSQIKVGPESSRELTAHISFEEDIRPGLKDLVFRIEDISSDSVNLSFKVLEAEEDKESRIELGLDRSYIEAESGKTVSLEFRASNEGDVREEVEPVVEMPGKSWEYNLTPQKADIGSGEFQDFQLEVDVPETVSTGDYFADIGLNNSEGVEEKSVRFAVSSSSGYGLTGVIIVLTVFFLLAVFYRLFGRR